MPYGLIVGTYYAYIHTVSLFNHSHLILVNKLIWCPFLPTYHAGEMLKPSHQAGITQRQLPITSSR